MINPNNYSYYEIKIGKKFFFKKKIIEEDLNSFAKLTGDFNPLHMDEEYAKSTRFQKRLVHGMLAASLFSTLLGMVCPGKKNLYLSQTLNFKKPIYPNSELIVQGTVLNKIDSIKVVIIKTEILVENVLVIDGEAKVRVLD